MDCYLQDRKSQWRFKSSKIIVLYLLKRIPYLLTRWVFSNQTWDFGASSRASVLRKVFELLCSISVTQLGFESSARVWPPGMSWTAELFATILYVCVWSVDWSALRKTIGLLPWRKFVGFESGKMTVVHFLTCSVPPPPTSASIVMVYRCPMIDLLVCEEFGLMLTWSRLRGRVWVDVNEVKVTGRVWVDVNKVKVTGFKSTLCKNSR